MARKLKDNFKNGLLGPQVTPDWLNTVARRLNNITIVDGDVEITDREIVIFPNTRGPISAPNFQKPFDFSEIGAKNFKISYAQTINATWYRGKRVASISAGAGLTFDTDGWIATSDLTESQFIWLEIDNSNAGATSIIMGTDMQATPSDARYDYIEVFPLWYIPYADAKINFNMIFDMRGAFKLSAMA